MTTLGIVEQGNILRGTVGSTVHGLHHGGQDDRDEMAVFIEPPEYLIGLRLARKQGVRNPYRFEHWIERTQPRRRRSGPGDLDLVAYSLRKYVRLALKGDRAAESSFRLRVVFRLGMFERLHARSPRRTQVPMTSYQSTLTPSPSP